MRILSLYQIEFKEGDIFKLVDSLTRNHISLRSLYLKLSAKQCESEEFNVLKKTCLEKKISLNVVLENSEQDLLEIILHLVNNTCEKTYDFYSNILSFLNKNPESTELSQHKFLDLSNLEISIFPETLIPFFSNVEKVSLVQKTNLSSAQLIQIIKSILKLPKIRVIDLRGNVLNISDLKEIFEEVKNAKFLKQIDVRQNPNLAHQKWEYSYGPSPEQDFYREFIRHCKEKDIFFIRDVNDFDIEEYLRAFRTFNIKIHPTFLDLQDFEERSISALTSSNEESLSQISSLDLSDANFERFPRKLIPYLSGVREVRLSNRYQGVQGEKTHLLANVLTLPELEYIDFSGNVLTPHIIANFEFLLKNPAKKLKQIILFDCKNKESKCFEDLKKLCVQNGVILQQETTLSSDQKTDLVQLFEVLKNHLDQELTHWKIPFQFESVDEFLTQIGSENLRQLQRISELHLEDISIGYLPPEVIHYLSNVQKVYFNKTQDSQNSFDCFEVIQELLKLPNLQILDLSGQKTLSQNSENLIESILDAKNLSEVILIDTDLSFQNLDWEFLLQAHQKNISIRLNRD